MLLHWIQKKCTLPKMKKLFEWGILGSGSEVYLKSHPEEKAIVINEKKVK